jgi:hypothetical protein
VAHGESDQREGCAWGRWFAFGVESSGAGKPRRLDEECVENRRLA